MTALIIAQLKRLSTSFLYEVAIALIKLLFKRTNSSMNVDAKEVVGILRKNMVEDEEAGFTEAKAYSRERRR
jgi:hypothetical protein